MHWLISVGGKGDFMGQARCRVMVITTNTVLLDGSLYHSFLELVVSLGDMGSPFIMCYGVVQ